MVSENKNKEKTTKKNLLKEFLLFIVKLYKITRKNSRKIKSACLQKKE